jgi:5'-nucleotidase
MTITATPSRRSSPRARGFALANALCTLAVVSAAAHAADAASPPICGDGPLEILLTNDDGFQAPGIRALYAALRSAGHHVTLAAPVANASGSSASFTWTAVRIVREPADPNVFGVAASPATAVVLAATALYPPDRRPDLVISGINDGQNTGSLLVLSGTVGAALAGTMLLDRPVPGIAVSAERPATTSAKESLPADQMQFVARHLAQLVGGSRTWFCEGGRLVRPTTVLNVNYPARPIATLRGLVVARQGRTTDLHIDFEKSGPDSYASRPSSGTPEEDYPDSDVRLLAEGYVTVTPITAQIGARDAPVEGLKQLLTATKFR